MDLNYLQLVNQIASRLNRDDLDDPTASPPITIIREFVQDRINYYAKEFFYSAQFTDLTKTCTIGSPWVNLPSGWQEINYIRILQGANWIPLSGPRRYQDVVAKDVQQTPPRALPAEWAPYNNPTGGSRAIRVYPVPNLFYPLEFTMNRPPDAPSLNTDTNFWTQDAQTLIIEATIEALCDLKINNPARAAKARTAKEAEERSLSSKTIRIEGGIQIRSWM